MCSTIKHIDCKCAREVNFNSSKTHVRPPWNSKKRSNWLSWSKAKQNFLMLWKEQKLQSRRSRCKRILANFYSPWLSISGMSVLSGIMKIKTYTNTHTKVLRAGEEKLTPGIEDAFLRPFLCFLSPSNLQMLPECFSSVVESLPPLLF